MKKKRSSKGAYFLVFLAFLTIVLLVGGAFYLNFYMSGKTFTDLKNGDLEDVITIQEPDVIIEETAAEDTHSLIFVGDSRTAGMKNAVLGSTPDDQCQFIAKDGEGLAWFQSTGSLELDAVLKEAPDSTVVLNLGVNDLLEIDAYIAYYPQLFASYPDAAFYLMSVNPVTDDCQVVSNQAIDEFNQKIKAAFPDQYLDVYNFLLTGDFSTVDGLHYTDSTYSSIHYYVTNRLS